MKDRLPLRYEMPRPRFGAGSALKGLRSGRSRERWPATAGSADPPSTGSGEGVPRLRSSCRAADTEREGPCPSCSCSQTSQSTRSPPAGASPAPRQGVCGVVRKTCRSASRRSLLTVMPTVAWSSCTCWPWVLEWLGHEGLARRHAERHEADRADHRRGCGPGQNRTPDDSRGIVPAGAEGDTSTQLVPKCLPYAQGGSAAAQPAHGVGAEPSLTRTGSGTNQSDALPSPISFGLDRGVSRFAPLGWQRTLAPG